MASRTSIEVGRPSAAVTPHMAGWLRSTDKGRAGVLKRSRKPNGDCQSRGHVDFRKVIV